LDVKDKAHDKMENHPKNQNGLKNKLHQGIGSHKMGKLIENGFTEDRSDIDCEMLQQKHH
jgi:hypothetical protein